MELRNRIVLVISIHAPRVGSDDDDVVEQVEQAVFQSTLPVWGATIHHSRPYRSCSISIHAPRVGSDYSLTTRCLAGYEFQSTLPVWGATRR